ncbi:hypothetical protein Tgr7_1401 [Thioalkalivibrio sulfidiphilus HL-EbGr7]|uniref:Uncharacterized protein n=1 Tax=Thioalkalivibrio sulfidiphilus (strain HL-EbGR7) TaxID=396588 RepID=B8GR66_THISH|nr:DUF302 domain-containing protein [Thioalkalivibrio sulfidiphilus]ACL72486.1 hypothetical protein Tgr7_1401 [Thioalkalivibrio sulfidiphilus HL-EbGr7]
MKSRILIALVTCLCLFSQASLAKEPLLETEHMRVYSVEGEFATYREALEMAITNRGIVINNVAYIGNMLKRTAADVGGKPLYQEGEALEFCSAVISRRMMEADIHNIVFCPYIVAVYVTKAEPNTVYVSYRRPIPVGDDASRESLMAVEELLEEIVQETLDAF